ncbi:hypothetical protein [Treponema zioleckii]|uniref:hypothetical protein n=1 Tax=Treponema zioleckii TaxID=331680 RepID=UPI00168B6433|nr:hypothetical protein [Treponema zioleckii]
MKFKIRYADQIVGVASLAAIAALIVLIFAIGANQNWFAKKNSYYTFFVFGGGFFNRNGFDVQRIFYWKSKVCKS